MAQCHGGPARHCAGKASTNRLLRTCSCHRSFFTEICSEFVPRGIGSRQPLNQMQFVAQRLVHRSELRCVRLRSCLAPKPMRRRTWAPGSRGSQFEWTASAAVQVSHVACCSILAAVVVSNACARALSTMAFKPAIRESARQWPPDKWPAPAWRTCRRRHWANHATTEW